MAVYNGAEWFRLNIMPYLTEIKSSIGGASYPAPIISSFTPTEFIINTPTTITAVGDFFTPTTVITSNTATISNYTYIDQQHCSFTITTPTAQSNTVIVDNGSGNADILINSIAASTWVDLRAGSSSVFTEEHAAGTTLVRDANGISTTGSLWSTWVRFTSDTWTRSTPKKCSIIITSDFSIMAGIVDLQNQDKTSVSQFYEGEIYGLIASNLLIGFYGTDSLDNGVSTSSDPSNPINITTSYCKLQFTNNGSAGSTFKIFGMGNITNLDDESNLLRTITIGAVHTANGQNIMPCALASGDARIVAYKVEDI